MSDFDDGSVLKEAVSGKWYRFAKQDRSTMLMDLPNGVLLGFHMSRNMVEVFVPDEHDIYHRAGDLTFTGSKQDKDYSINLKSEALKQVHIGSKNGVVENTFNEISDIRAFVDLNEKDKWWSKALDSGSNNTFE
ncbi:hypothetical protein [Marinococcus luteus]|uniref:hypothetical protein n=1 Tax=Marinococcus luteus TaxID=1122204 RepID=UPI002ACC4EEB|nr:hypothetical protein [Marinococcus luteus]MDZ5782086.1 hypothetical protein [Marinococcus luteus]